MNRIYKLCVLLLCVVMSACQTHKTNTANPNYSGIDTIEVKSNYAVFDVSRVLSLRLDSINDSRCPKGVQCAWEGNAKAQFEVKMSHSGETHKIQLNTNPRFAQDTILHNYRFRLLDLKPYPADKEPIFISTYKAYIIVTRR